ncbi:MAG: hypothetical protein D6796_02310, partial [Caldilineae bacterium]
MLPSFETLQKILLEEQKDGCQDKIVLGGGLASFAKNWLPKALAEATRKEERLLIEKIAVALKNYSDLPTPQERQTALQAILADLAGAPPPAPTSAPA